MTLDPKRSDELVGDLNDLLRLDYDAVQAYELAIQSLGSHRFRAELERFRADHERHIDELTTLITNYGGMPARVPHLATGAFKLAVQRLGTLGGGDRSVLLAFKANERQVRDKYRRAAERSYPPDVTVYLGRAAQDEARHYAWALESLDDLGLDRKGRTARVEGALEVAHKGMADALEGAGKRTGRVAGRTKRVLAKRGTQQAIGAVLVVAGAGFAAARWFRNR